ncbi:restriction endonuclease subunit S [Staphylococcus haemolyticus]|uniref:restriction endonuclease subunit S n=1 Tax=Staphylococcus haemolyticus TaxID=1283 RepID=UPI001F0AE0F2|nr:restriction endonuclease subunit S [Staphylococcus haemolyticus]MCH4390678.1 restriction endonuclease subunit S [Staphylococcus haemolyticus]
MTEQINTPELRFPEFKREWKEYQFQTHLSKIETGTNKLGSEDYSGLPLLKMGNIQRGNFSFNKLEKLKKDEVVNNEHLIQNKDFLFNTRNTMELVGKSATWRGESNRFVFNSNIARLTLENIDTVFFNYLYNTPKLIHKVKSLAVGTTSVAAIYPRDLKKLKYFIPIFDEQLKIGEFFSKLDRQIELEEKKLELLEQQKRGYMQKIFTQQLRFKSENGNDYPEWKKEIIGNIATTFSGGTPSSNNSTFYTGEIPFIRSGEISKTSTELMINEKAISNSSAKMVETGDLLYALYGATSGEVAISKINGAINQAVLCIRSQESIGYIFNYLKMKKDQILKTYIQGGQGNLSASIIKKVDIDLPSLEEQEKIGTFFNKIDNLIELQANKVDLLKQRKKGLLQKMFI